MTTPLTSLFGSERLPLYTSDEVPSWMTTTPFILNGYRYHVSAADCLRSVFQLHNETVNIWTHLPAALLFWYFAYKYAPWKNRPQQQQQQQQQQDCCTALLSLEQLAASKTSKSTTYPPVISFFCITQACPFTASAFAHTFSAMSEEMYNLCWKLDWTMIAVAMLGLCHAIVHFAFGYSPQYRQREKFWKGCFSIYVAMLMTLFNLPFFTNMAPCLKAVGAFMIAPAAALFFLDMYLSLPKQDSQRIWNDMKAPLLLAILGCGVIYGGQIPERFYPGVFDLTGASHALHHLWTFSFSLMVGNNILQWDQWRSSSSITKTLSEDSSSSLTLASTASIETMPF